MAKKKQKSQGRKVSRQSWKASPFLRVLKGLWTGVYSVFKVAMGALATVVLIGGICMLVFAWLLGGYLEKEILPNAATELDSIMLRQNSYAYYIDRNGNIQPLQKIYADVSSQWVDYEDIPEDLIHAAVAIEDKRFFEHQGVDWFTTMKACVNMFVGSGSQFGGSSITQQLIKNIFGEDDVTVQRKVLEIFRATELEKRYSKDTVMEYYLNYIYLGQRCNGVKAAAATYFGKELDFLTPAECASLISITNNPSRFDPYRTSLDSSGKTGMERNLERRNTTLKEMRNQGYLTEEEYQEAIRQEIVLKRGIDDADRLGYCENEDCGYRGKVSTFDLRDDGKYYCPQCGTVTSIGEDASQDVYSWFMDTVLEDVGQDLAEKMGIDWESMTSKEKRNFITSIVAKGGYHIYTTLDYDVQKTVDSVYQNLENIAKTQSVQQLQSGIAVVDNRTGDIVAMAGGVGKDKGFDDFNRATDAHLQPGSSIKPVAIYAPAFELGTISPATVIKDLPLYYTGSRPFPYNDDRRYDYSRTILSGVVSSVNAVAVNTLDKIGLPYSFHFAKDKFGLSDLVEKYVNSQGTVFSDINYSPLGMGAPTIGITIRDMTAAYATFPNNGVYREARTYTKVYDSQGNLVLDNTQDSNPILSEKTVNYMNYCLDQAVQGGTGKRADLAEIGIDVCGKTGTTASNKDRWFCGFTNYYTAAVWCGYDVPEVISLVGDTSNPACRLWKQVMQPLHQGLSSKPMYDSSKMVDVTVCLDCGKKATSACSLDARCKNPTKTSRVSVAKVYPEDVPREECDCHVVVDWCDSCNAAANEYCLKLAAVGKCKISKRSVTKMRQTQVDAIAKASKNGLRAWHQAENYVYLVDDAGKPSSYKGLFGNQNKNINEPYLVCNIHTEKDWEDYLAAHPGAGEDTP